MFTCVNLMCKLYIGKKLRIYIYIHIYKYECVIVIIVLYSVVYNIIALALSDWVIDQSKWCYLSHSSIAGLDEYDFHYPRLWTASLYFCGAMVWSVLNDILSILIVFWSCSWQCFKYCLIFSLVLFDYASTLQWDLRLLWSVRSILTHDFKGTVCETFHQLFLIVYQSLTSTVLVKKPHCLRLLLMILVLFGFESLRCC